MADINVSLAAPEAITVTLTQSVITGNFTDLADTPSSYSGEASKFVRVNAGETALEFSTTTNVIDWGDIIGTLSDQTDLQSALDLKYDSADFNTDWDTRLATKFTTNLTEGTNLYYTEARVSANTNVSANTVHKTSDGTDHTYINQDIKNTASPSFVDIKISGKVYLDFTSDSYFEYNSGTGEVDLYVGGTIKASW